MSEAALFLIALALAVAAILVWRKVLQRPRHPHVHNWDYRGENRWSKERMRMEHVEWCIGGQACDEIMRLTPWEKEEYGSSQPYICTHDHNCARTICAPHGE